jgi:formylglycine-generating enzyme required for sulfatase activity
VFGCVSTAAGCTGWQSDLAPVGSRPLGDGRYGHADLQGSVLEWNWDHYAYTWYETVGESCTDCVNLHTDDPADWASVRSSPFLISVGGSSFLRNAARGGMPRTGKSQGVGIRCARNW